MKKYFLVLILASTFVVNVHGVHVEDMTYQRLSNSEEITTIEYACIFLGIENKKDDEDQNSFEKRAKKQYLLLSKKYHPDKTTDENLKKIYNELFKKISTAYELIQGKRQEGAGVKEAQKNPYQDTYDFINIFLDELLKTNISDTQKEKLQNRAKLEKELNKDTFKTEVKKIFDLLTKLELTEQFFSIERENNQFIFYILDQELEILDFLFENGMNPNITKKSELKIGNLTVPIELNPLSYALDNKKNDFRDLLFKYGAKPTTDHLNSAVMSNDLALTDLLLQNGAPRNLYSLLIKASMKILPQEEYKKTLQKEFNLTCTWEDIINYIIKVCEKHQIPFNKAELNELKEPKDSESPEQWLQHCLEYIQQNPTVFNVKNPKKTDEYLVLSSKVIEHLQKEATFLAALELQKKVQQEPLAPYVTSMLTPSKKEGASLALVTSLLVLGLDIRNFAKRQKEKHFYKKIICIDDPQAEKESKPKKQKPLMKRAKKRFEALKAFAQSYKKDFKKNPLKHIPAYVAASAWIAYAAGYNKCR